MLDPVTVIATASAAYNALKKGIEIGRELQDMGGQLAQWAGAVSDLDFLVKKAENPVWWRVGSNVQAEAMEIFAAKKKIEAQRNELRTYVQYSYGQSGWEELMRIEAQVRKRKQATDHRRAEIKELLITITIVGLALLAGVGGLALLAYFLVQQQ
jgi:prophage DNA circulation protein